MKTKELLMLLNELSECGHKLVDIAEEIKKEFSSTSEHSEVPKEPSKKEVNKKDYSKEEVRDLLARKAREDEGKHKEAVKALVSEFSSDGTFTQIPEDRYPDLVSRLEAMDNG